MRLNLAEVQGLVGGRLAGAAPEAWVRSYHTDSRQVQPDGLFFALRGQNHDGGAFVPDALRRGAAAAVTDAEGEGPRILVEDPWMALYALAEAVLGRVAPLVLGVTGSNGKTSTRELIAAALAGSFRVHRTSGNLNTETGLPVTVLGLEPGHTALVLEMGMQGPGEIARLAALARPRVGVVTGIGSVHAEYFADGTDGIARAKGELLEALPSDGLALLNADDAYFEVLRSRSPAPVLSFGLGRGDLLGRGYQALPDGCGFQVDDVRVRLRLRGRHQARNALAALGAARFAGVPLAEAADRLSAVAELDHRLQELPQSGGWTLIDDAYNASPESMEAAFEALAERPRSGRRLALLGEMRELGALAPEAHRRTGEAARRIFDEIAVLEVGWGRALAEAAGARLLPDLDSAASWLRQEARPGDVVLVKASNGVGLYRLPALLEKERV
jgi:UDP-N-acetylmuramoyl-tripeptide--D-alanyl-D-alanine ligase